MAKAARNDGDRLDGESLRRLSSKEVESRLSRQLLTADPAWFDARTVAEVKGRIDTLVTKTSEAFVKRKELAEMIAASFVSGVPLLLMGPPGTAKSAIVRRAAGLCGLSAGAATGSGAEKIGGGYFEYLLHSHTVPEELFGGFRLSQLSEGNLKRNTAGKLPEAEIAFLDELFRGQGNLLNTLLTIINEKRYDSGEGPRHVPLLGVVAAANYAPADQNVDALFDRFPIRVWLRSLFDTDGSDESLKGDAAMLVADSLAGERERLARGWSEETAARRASEERVAFTNDFRYSRAYLLCLLGVADPLAATTAGPTRLRQRFEQFAGLFREVRVRTPLSDRSFGQLWLFGAALDFIRNQSPIEAYPAAAGHLLVLRHVARSKSELGPIADIHERRTRGIGHTSNV